MSPNVSSNPVGRSVVQWKSIWRGQKLGQPNAGTSSRVRTRLCRRRVTSTASLLRKSALSMPRSRQLLIHVAFNTNTCWSTFFTCQLFIFVTTTTKIMKLSLQQWRHILVRNMTVHALSAPGVVNVVMVATQAVLTDMTFMSKVHWEYRIRAKPSMLSHRLFGW